jgi:hypothetical protein
VHFPAAFFSISVFPFVRGNGRLRSSMGPVKQIVPLLVLATMLTAAGARAQTVAQPPDESQMRVKLGPFYMNPTLALTNAGVDTNVFNDADDAHPQSDFTVTISPKTDLWIRLGRTWVQGVINEDIVWYKKFADQRSANSEYKVNWIVPLTRVAFSVGGDGVNAKERPGFEIDLRSQRSEKAFNGAMEIRALSKTFFGVHAEHRHISFDQGDVFLGANLNNELTRGVTTEGVTIRNQLTPLTNLTIDVSREQDRFDFDELRDSDSTQISAALKFDRLALLKGGLQFGLRNFVPLTNTVPSFTGVTMATDLSYVLLGSTRLATQVTRDVQYSYDVNQPYYVQTGFTASLAQQIFGPFDIQGRIGAARLAYRTREGATVPVPDRVDHTTTYGAGLGYHMGQDLRLAFNIDQIARESAVDGRSYHGLKYGTAVTYGF